MENNTTAELLAQQRQDFFETLIPQTGRIPYEFRDGTLTPSMIVQMCHSPKHFYSSYILNEFEETAAMREGNLFHEFFLEPEKFNQKYCPPFCADEHPDALCTVDQMKEECRRLGLKLSGSKAELEARILESNPDAKLLSKLISAHSAGKTPIQDDLWRRLHRVKQEIQLHPYASKLVLGEGDTEVPGYFKCPRTGVVIRFRADKIVRLKSRYVVVDLKRTDKVQKKKFETFMYDSHLHVLAALYVDGFKAILGEEPLFCWTVTAPKSPFIVKTYVADFGCLEAGRVAAYHAIEKWKECRATNVWPSDDDGLIEATLPSWAWRDLEDEAEEESEGTPL
jgi:hypothetical protein